MKIEEQLEITERFLNTSKEKICYITVCSEVCKLIAERKKNDFQIIDLADDFSPFKPILQIVSDLNPDEKLVRRTAYSIQADTFVSYFKTGLAEERYDIPIDSEQVYETQQFVKSIAALFCQLNKSNYIFLNAQNIYQNSITLLKNLEKQDFTGRLIFCFNSDISKYSKAVIDFLEENNTQPNFLYLKENSIENSAVLAYEMEVQTPEFYGNEELENRIYNDFDLTYRIMHNNRTFMCIEQLKDIVSWVTLNLPKFNFSSYQKRILTFEIAMACYKCRIEDEACLYLNDLTESNEDDDFTTAAYFYLARIFYLKKSNEFAKKYALQARERLESKKESPYYALLTMLEFQFVKRSEVKIATKKYMEALDVLASHGFTNNYISTGLTVPWNLINDVKSRPLIDKTIDHCMETAKKCGNQHLYSSACHWKGIIHSHYGESDEAMYWYNECNKIRTEIGEFEPLMNIRNGLSYESMCRALYKDAYNLVNGIIKNLYNLSDYSRIIDCLKNIAYALFFSRHFKTSQDIFTLILHFLHIFNLDEQANNSFLPTSYDILMFQTIINLDRKDVIHARINYSTIEQNKERITIEDAPLLNFIKAILLVIDGKIEDAENSLIRCVQQFREIKNPMAHKICFVYYEFAYLLETYGQPELSKKYFHMGYSLSKENKFEYYTRIGKNISGKDYLANIEKFDDLNIDLAFMDEKAEKEQLLTQLHKRIHDYQFLNKIKTNNLKSSTLAKYVENSIMYIFEYTLADAVYIGECADGIYRTINSINRSDEKEIPQETWQKLFETSENREVSQFILKPEDKLYFGNITQFEFKFAIIIVPSKQNPLTGENISTLNIALSAIQSQIVIYKQDENLVFLSTTDTLSLLNNRHALQEYIKLEGDKIRRYEQRKSTRIQIAVAFIDLDNFKYYNDSFGHNAGDLLITCFAKLLRKTCRQIDFISRFGGDEFVIVMVDTDENEAYRVYERLLEQLKKDEHFIPDLKKILGINTLDIPEKSYLGFSMGISTNFDLESPANLNEVLENADKALYYSKEHQKGSCSIWSKVKSLV